MNDIEKIPTKLPFHERLVAITLILFVLFFVGLNLYFDEGLLPETQLEHPQTQPTLIEITIQGAVQTPGTYQVPKGSTVKSALELAQPLPNANLKRIKLDSKILRRRTLTIHPN